MEIYNLSDQELLKLYEESEEYISEQCKEICKRVDMLEDWEQANDETFEDVIAEAVEKLEKSIPIYKVKAVRYGVEHGYYDFENEKYEEVFDNFEDAKDAYDYGVECAKNESYDYLYGDYPFDVISLSKDGEIIEKGTQFLFLMNKGGLKMEEKYLKTIFTEDNNEITVKTKAENLDQQDFSLALYSVAILLKDKGYKDLLKKTIKSIEENLLD